MNSVTDHFPNNHASCSETCHLPLYCTTTATTSHHNIFTPSENAIMCAQIDMQTGLKDMYHSDLRHRSGVFFTSMVELFWFWI